MRYSSVSLASVSLASVSFVLAIAIHSCVTPNPLRAQAPDSPASDRDKLLTLHRADVAQYNLFRDPAKKEKLALKSESVYRWTNPTRSGGQVGDVFIWTYEGRAEAIASIFSHPENGRRVLCHELHSLSPVSIVSERDSSNIWRPKGGITTRLLKPSPEPAETPVKRLIQLRNMARDFKARSVDERGEQWELRLLPQPLYRYEATTGDIFDGAVFAFVTSAGTDPEIALKIEATRVVNKPSEWRFAAARFSDLNLYLSYQDQEVWQMVRDHDNEFDRNRDETFRFYRDRVVDEVVGATEEPKKSAGN